MILVIDNYDSFTYNLVQLIETMGGKVEVFRNDEISIRDMERRNPAALLISPGPCTPEKAGISVDAIHYFAPKIPILGVCLGHQAIAVAYGGKVVRADRIMHGKASAIFHDGKTVYRHTPSPFEAIRYHSLIVERTALPECLEVSAWTEQGEIMGVRHRQYRAEGMQFHPESILTQAGMKLMQTFFHREEIDHDQTGNRKGSETRRPAGKGDGGGHGGNHDRQCHTRPDRFIYHGPQDKGRDGG